MQFPTEQIFALGNPPTKRLSAAIALGLCVLLGVVGWGLSFWLAHAGKPLLLLLFWPVIPLFVLFGSGGPMGEAPEWLFLIAGFVCMFCAYFCVVHFVRYAYFKGRKHGG